MQGQCQRQVGIKLQCLLHGGFRRLRIDLICRSTQHPHVAVHETLGCPRQGIIGVDGNCPVDVFEGARQRFEAKFVQFAQRQRILAESLHAFSIPSDEAGSVSIAKRNLQSIDDLFSDFVLNGEDVVEFAVEIARPQVEAGFCLDQLCRYPNLVTGCLHAAFENVGHIQLLAHFANVDILSAKLKGRIARDHAQAVNLCELVQNRVGESVGKVTSARVLAHIHEG